jgi:esterase/lipase superfamily enzyme
VFEKLSTTLICLVTLALAAGCAGNPDKEKRILLMPAPEVYEEGKLDPFIDNDPISRGVPPGILFATDRAPAEAGDRKYDHYTHERGDALRLGIADIVLGTNSGMTWEEARELTLLKNRTDDYPLQVGRVEEFGVLARTIKPGDRDDIEVSDLPRDEFIAAINERLATSAKKDVYIYVHGYKVNFENPLLVSAELWHFLGYQGAFVAYSWPTKFSVTAYLADLDSAVNSARNLRSLMVEIAKHSDAERIHVIGYSAGTRLVARMLADFGIYASTLSDEQIRELKLDNVILIGSDIDRSIFGGYVLDGALRIPRTLTIYQADEDGALAWSNRIFNRERLGQAFREVNPKPAEVQWFRDHPQLRFVNVTEADEGEVKGGHGYFRKSPWVSSDILMTLMYGLEPAERGLVSKSDFPEWHFPPDYVERLRQSLVEINPALSIASDGTAESEP